MADLSPRSWGIPVVASTAERNALFTSPATNQRVYNLETGAVERWTGSAWLALADGPTVFNITDSRYGAIPGQDATNAIGGAIDGASSNGGMVFVPPGVFTATDTLTIDAGGVCVSGVSSLHTLGSSILFNPSTARPCFLFQNASAASPLFRSSIQDIVGASSNSVQKTFIKAVDVSEFDMRRVSTDSSWSGNGSIGVEIQGREFVRSHGCTFFADRPMVLSQNPRHASIDVDTFTFHDTYLGATDGTYNNVEIGNTGVAEIRSLRNLCFDGLFMVQGKGGISWISTVSSGAQDCLGLIVHRGGIEQTQDSSGYFLNVEKINSTLFNVDLRHIQPASTGQHGVRLRHVSHASIDHLQWADTGGSRKVFDVDSTVSRLSWKNLWTQQGAGSSLSGQTLIRATGRSSSSDYTLPPNADYDNVATVANIMGGALQLTPAGAGVQIKEGTNATMGVATLVAGTVGVSTTKVTASSRVALWRQSKNGGTMGHLEVSSVVAGTAFQITSSSGSDTSIVAWMIVEPA